MFPDIERKETLNYPQASILSAIINICQEKEEYELLEEVSNHALQIFVKHHSKVLQKDTGYYLRLKLHETPGDTVELVIDTEKGFQPLSAAVYFDVNQIIKEFLFTLKQYLQVSKEDRD